MFTCKLYFKWCKKSRVYPPLFCSQLFPKIVDFFYKSAKQWPFFMNTAVYPRKELTFWVDPQKDRLSRYYCGFSHWFYEYRLRVRCISLGYGAYHLDMVYITSVQCIFPGTVYVTMVWCILTGYGLYHLNTVDITWVRSISPGYGLYNPITAYATWAIPVTDSGTPCTV
jgi:hypothetical protein